MKSIHINNLQSITFFKTKLESRGDHHIPNLIPMVYLNGRAVVTLDPH